MSLIKHNKSHPSGFTVSQGGIYPVAGFDPLNYKTSIPLGVSQLKGDGMGADILGVLGGVAGGIAGAITGNPYVAGLGGYAGKNIGQAVGNLIGLGNTLAGQGGKKTLTASHKKKLASLKGGFLGITLANTKKLLKMVAIGASGLALAIAMDSMGVPKSQQAQLDRDLSLYWESKSETIPPSYYELKTSFDRIKGKGKGKAQKGGIGRPEMSKTNFNITAAQAEAFHKKLSGKGIFSPNASGYGMAQF